MVTTENAVLSTFYGDEEFPIQWEEGERELFWIYDDLHIPNPVSPMFFDIGGWWLTCDHMFRRFGTPFASDWIAKNINGYVYTAAVPADSSLHVEATEYQSRYVPRVPRDPSYPEHIGAYMVTLPSGQPQRLQTLRDAGIEIIVAEPEPSGQIDLAAALGTLGERGLTRLLVEGGGRLAASLLRAGLVDRLAWLHAPLLLGADAVPAVAALEPAALAAMPRFERISTETLGDDVLSTFRQRSEPAES